MEEGENFAKRNNLHAFFETSAKSGYNIENCFQEIVKKLYYSVNSNTVLQSTHGISVISNNNKKKKCC
jgi:hypothetical protein